MAALWSVSLFTRVCLCVCNLGQQGGATSLTVFVYNFIFHGFGLLQAKCVCDELLEEKLGTCSDSVHGWSKMWSALASQHVTGRAASPKRWPSSSATITQQQIGARILPSMVRCFNILSEKIVCVWWSDCWIITKESKIWIDSFHVRTGEKAT